MCFAVLVHSVIWGVLGLGDGRCALEGCVCFLFRGWGMLHWPLGDLRVAAVLDLREFYFHSKADYPEDLALTGWGAPW